MSLMVPHGLPRLRAPGPRTFNSAFASTGVHLAQRQHCVPEREFSPSVFGVARQIAGATRRTAIALRGNRGRRRAGCAGDPRCTCRNRKDPDCFFRGSRLRARGSASSLRRPRRERPVTIESLYAQQPQRAARLPRPRMWRADADAMRSPVNRTIPFERSEGKPANICPRRTNRAIPWREAIQRAARLHSGVVSAPPSKCAADRSHQSSAKGSPCSSAGSCPR